MKLALIGIAVVATLMNMGQAGAASDGKATYDKACAVCHAKGLAGAPKLGDKSAWESRMKNGSAAMTASVIAGKGAMAPRAGVPSLTDADIKAAVEYIMAQTK